MFTKDVESTPLGIGRASVCKSKHTAAKKIYLEAILFQFNIRDPALGTQLRERHAIRHDYDTRAMRGKKTCQPRYRLERTRRLYKNHYLQMLDSLPPEIKNNTTPKISAKKKLIREFVRGLSANVTDQLFKL